MNAKAEVLLGVSLSQILDKKLDEILEIFDTTSKKINFSDLSTLSLSPDKDIRFEFKTPDKKLWLNVKTIKNITQDTQIYILLLSTLDDTNAELTRMQSFYSQAAHDLKTPITIIKSVVELLLDKNDQLEKIKQKELMSDIKSQSEILQNLVEDILNIARLEQGKIQPNLVAVPINEIITSSLGKMKTLIKNKGLGLNFDSASSSAIKVKADSHLLQTIVDNLLSNAVKYTFAGNITIDAKQDNSRVDINITDTGVGIDKEHQSLLFKLYQQVGEARKLGADKSTGLGLFIARQMARLMLGDVELTASEPGKGSTFTLRLPIA
jgi:signal transduction histidine kinase